MESYERLTECCESWVAHRRDFFFLIFIFSSSLTLAGETIDLTHENIVRTRHANLPKKKSLCDDCFRSTDWVSRVNHSKMFFFLFLFRLSTKSRDLIWIFVEIFFRILIFRITKTKKFARFIFIDYECNFFFSFSGPNSNNFTIAYKLLLYDVADDVTKWAKVELRKIEQTKTKQKKEWTHFFSTWASNLLISCCIGSSLDYFNNRKWFLVTMTKFLWFPPLRITCDMRWSTIRYNPKEKKATKKNLEIPFRPSLDSYSTWKWILEISIWISRDFSLSVIDV